MARFALLFYAACVGVSALNADLSSGLALIQLRAENREVNPAGRWKPPHEVNRPWNNKKPSNVMKAKQFQNPKKAERVNSIKRWKKPSAASLDVKKFPEEGILGNHEAGAKKPHIIIVLLDDLGWNGMGYNNAWVRTPYMDELAKWGVKLERHYSAPVCAPSRFSLLTGRRGWQSEAWGSANFDPMIPVGTSPSYVMLPAALKKAGYSTHMVGKWHQGFHQASYTPKQRGFDSFYGILGGDSDHFTQAPCATMCGKDAVYDLMGNNTPVPFSHDDGKMGDDRYREEAVKLINAHDKSKPFFLYLSLQFPHKPYQVTEEYSKLYTYPDKEKNTYFGMISHADDTVKAVAGAMIKKDMFQNAVFVVMSDNGAPVPNSPAEAKKQNIIPDGNFPLKKGKGSIFDGGIRTVAFVNGGYLPDKARGKTRTGYMSISDWYATLAHVAGAQQPQGGPVEADSYNNWAYIVGDAEKSERTGLVEMAHRGSEGLMEVALLDGEWKMVVGADTCTQDKPCLYNIMADPEETSEVNNATIHSKMKSKMLELVDAAKRSAWFGLHPSGQESGNGWQDRRAFYGPKLCRAVEHAGGYVVPWAGEADIKFNLQNAKKNLLLE